MISKTGLRQVGRPLLRSILVATFLLPFSLNAQWVQTGGPKGGYCTVYGVFGSTVFAGAGGRILHSTDAGASWVVDEDLKNPQTIISVGNMLFAASWSEGVLRSYDKGRSWLPANDGLLTKRASTLLASGPCFFVGTDSGAFRSWNNGGNWERVSNGLPGTYRARVQALAAKDGFLFAGTGSDGVYRSLDNGDHWMPVNVGLPGYSGCRSFAVQGSDLYATLGDLFMTTDNGGTWIRVKHPGYAEWVLSHGPHLFIGSWNEYGGLYGSSDGGLSWDTLISASNFSANALRADDNSLFVGTSRGLYRSTDLGTSWTELSSEFKYTSIQSLACYGSTLYAGAEVLFRSTDQGATWATWSWYSSPVYEILTGRGGMFIRTGDEIWRSTDGGLKWTDASNGLYWLNDLCMIDTTLFVQAGMEGDFRSTDYGASWTWVNPPLADRNRGGLWSVGDVLLASFFSPTSVYRSTDLGNFWTQVFSGYANTVLGADSTLFLWSDRVYRSTNKGNTWVPVDSGLSTPYPYIGSLVATVGIFFASSSDGVYRSTDRGMSWTPVNKGLSVSSVGNLISDGTYLYVVGADCQVWRRPLSELMTASVEEKGSDLPLTYRFEQNYPNPFNSATNIRFTIADEASVSMKVFDILGREVAILVNERRVPGTYSLTWDARTLPSGVYFCRMQTDFAGSGKAGTYVETKKLVLIK